MYVWAPLLRFETVRNCREIQPFVLLTIEAPGQVHVGKSLSSGVSCPLKQILDGGREEGTAWMERSEGRR